MDPELKGYKNHAFDGVAESKLENDQKMDLELKGYKNHAFDGVAESKLENDQSDYEAVAMDSKQDDSGCLGWMPGNLRSVFTNNQRTLIVMIKIVLLLLFFAYFCYAMYYEFGDEGSIRLLVCTCLGVFLLCMSLLSKPLARMFGACVPSDPTPGMQRLKKILYWCLCLSMAVFIIIYTGVEVGRHNPRNLVSLSGIAFFVISLTLTSTNIRKVKWHTVFWGMAIQYVFALVIIRTSWGFDAFDYLGDRVTELLTYASAGSVFVFGEANNNTFAFGVLSVIVYFSSLVSVLYHLGVMQAFIRVIGRFLAFCLNTSATESLNTAANIFVGQSESPLLIRPFLAKMTNSELHAVLTGGFATVSGSILGAYVSFGVKASYLLGASVMSAPAALAMSKLTCPETETSVIDQEEVFKQTTSSSRNLLDAATEGATTAIKLVANVAVNLIAFLAILAFINATLVWFGDRVGVEGLTFQFICSYVFYPMSYLMGVDEQDCRRVAQLIGFKTFANEFVAYIEMGKLLDNGEVYKNYTSIYGSNASISHDGLDVILPEWNTTLTGGFLTARSEVITTYALCGFSNLGSMGIMLGAMGGMAPSRKSDLSRLVLRALVAGSVACFMTACIAGLFFEERI